MAVGDVGRFVPDVVARAQAGGQPAPWSHVRSGVVLMVDVSGFTELTARLAAQGPGGAEVLAEVLNGSFGGIIAAVRDQGGDVVSFIGDAIQAWWPLDPDDPPAAVGRATAAALAAQRWLAAAPPHEGVTVQARAGVDLGPVRISVVGGHAGAWRPAVHGPPLVGAGLAAGLAARGEVVVSAAAAGVGRLAGEPVGDDAGHAVVRQVVLDAGLPPVPDADVAGRDDEGSRLAALLPRELAVRLRAGHGEWLAEFRHLSALFVAVDGLDDEAPGALGDLQRLVERVQQEVDRYDGGLYRIVEDEKALTLLAVWGLPDRTHEDDPFRAARAARGVVDALRAQGLSARAGVATGRCFTGVVGTTERADYTMLGDAMNLAARLMQSSADEVRCDAPTARVVADRLALTPLGPLVLKGKDGGTDAWRIDAGDRATGADPSTTARLLVGRAGERDRLVGRVQRLASTGRGGVVVLEGEPGIGKSALVAHLLHAAADAGVHVHLGEADAVERATGYYPWRAPLQGLVGQLADGGRVAVSDLARVLEEALADAPDLAASIPLLDAIVALGVEVPDVIEAMDPAVRADALRALVVALAVRAVAVGPQAVVLEDAHWMDSSSWALALEVARQVPGLLLVVTLRPLGEDAPVERARLLAEPDRVHVVLGPMGTADTGAVVGQALGATSVPPAVIAFIEERAEGNPFFSEQLALALRDAGHLVVDRASATLASGVDLDAITVPGNVRGVVAARVDQLTESEQLTLKVASVVGRIFAHRVLEAVHPLPDAADLGHDLDEATRLALTRAAPPAPEPAHLFTHVITQEVTYDLLVFAQRRALHRAVARWYETTVGDLTPHLGLLAHHWRNAGDPEAALPYLGRAGAVSLANHANAEALGLFTEALTLDDEAGHPTAPRVRADWERGRGIALNKMGRYPEAHPAFDAALALLGDPTPSGPAGRGLALARQAALAGWRRAHTSRLPPDGVADALAVSECHRYLGEVAYWEGDVVGLAHSAFAALNRAEPAGDSTELVVAAATVGFLLGMARVHRAARWYFALADRVGERVGSPDASGYADELDGVYALYRGDWPAARALAERAAALFAGVGDQMRWHTCFSLVGYAHLHQGQVEAARPYWVEGLAALGPEGHLQGRLWSLAGLLATDLARGQVDDTVGDELAELLGPAVHHDDEVLVRGLLASWHQRAGRLDEAGAEARRTVPMAEQFPPPSWHALTGLVGAAEVLLDAAAREGSGEAAAFADRARRNLARFGRFNPVAGASTALLAGRARRQAGRPGAARRAVRRARRRALASDLPLVAALADLELATLAPAGSPARQDAARRARDGLLALGATHDAGRAAVLLDEGDAPTGADPAGGQGPAPHRDEA